jgi:hypothetical protein
VLDSEKHCDCYSPPSCLRTSAGRPHTTKSESPGLLSKQRATDLLATPFPEKIGSMISADTRQKRIFAVSCLGLSTFEHMFVAQDISSFRKPPFFPFFVLCQRQKARPL